MIRQIFKNNISIHPKGIEKITSSFSNHLNSFQFNFNNKNDWDKQLKQMEKQFKQNRKAYKQKFNQYKKNDPNLHYKLFSVLFLIYAMYEAKRQKGQQIPCQELLQHIKKTQTDTIQLVKCIYSWSRTQQDKNKKQNDVKFEYKAYIKISGELFYALIVDPDSFKDRIAEEQTFKTYKTKIIEKEIVVIDLVIKKFFGVIAKVGLPLMLPFLLYNSSMGMIFKSKVLGQLDGIRPNVFFKDIAGLGNAKIQVSQLVDFLKNPKKYKEMGARVPKGALLAGPPGTGKTMLAKACAGEAEVPFFSVSGSEFVQLYAGMGATRVRDLFNNAKKQTPAIIFIDQIDAIGRKRQDKFGGANDQRANTLNQLLVEMDGFGTSDDIIILAATNRKQMLDSALTRPGRFDRIVQIQLPDIKGRKQILEIYLKKLKLSSIQTFEDYAKRISTLTFGFSGADLANLCNEAAILAVRKQRDSVLPQDFQAASDRVLAGLEQSMALDEVQKKKVAYHQCGHATVSWFLQGAAPLLKITIIPRSKGSLGFAQYLPNESSLMTKQQLMDQLCVMLGGRMAEEYFFKQVTNGASDDLSKVRQLARSIVITYGMNTKHPNYAPVQTDGHNIYSQKTAQEIDDQIHKLINECTLKTRIMIEQYKQKLTNLAEAVLKKESLNHQEIKQILGERPFQTKQNYKQFLQTSAALQKFHVNQQVRATWLA